jgi:hypothetical protein
LGRARTPARPALFKDGKGAWYDRILRSRKRATVVRLGRRYTGFSSLSLLALALPLGLGAGCSIAPKTFRSLTHPAAIVRARAVGLGNELPEEQVIPPLIARLDDTDAVVRLSAHEELKRRTGQDFGYVPWADVAERSTATARWRQWWDTRKATLARSGRIP